MCNAGLTSCMHKLCSHENLQLGYKIGEMTQRFKIIYFLMGPRGPQAMILIGLRTLRMGPILDVFIYIRNLEKRQVSRMQVHVVSCWWVPFEFWWIHEAGCSDFRIPDEIMFCYSCNNVPAFWYFVGNSKLEQQDRYPETSSSFRGQNGGNSASWVGPKVNRVWLNPTMSSSTKFEVNPFSSLYANAWKQLNRSNGKKIKLSGACPKVNQALGNSI